jgi:ADP-ribose pyrophosphatase YjhB (NUDIX family)
VPGHRRRLLARHRGAAEGAYATLAGFVEIVESLEDAVRRELSEEAGVPVREVSWFTRAEVRALGNGRPDSIESYLLRTWLSEMG